MAPGRGRTTLAQQYGRMKVVQDVEDERIRLGLNKDEMGVEAGTYRDFTNGAWAEGRRDIQARSLAAIAATIGWDNEGAQTISRRAFEYQLEYDPAVSRQSNSLAALLAETDDPDERALLLSNLDDAIKKRLYVRLIRREGGAAETLPESGSG